MSEIKLYNDDCINVLKNIKDKTIDLICTDIPYELHKHGGTNSELAKRSARMRDSIDFMAYGIDYDSVFSEFIRVCKIPNMIVFCSNLQVGKIISFFSEKGLKTDGTHQNIWNHYSRDNWSRRSYLYCTTRQRARQDQFSNRVLDKTRVLVRSRRNEDFNSEH